MSNQQTDEYFMARALQLAELGRYSTDPNPRVGCVLVKNGQIVAEGWHQRAGEAHAEIDALAKINDASGATAYVTLEPCSHFGRTGPCCDALINAGVSRIVAAMQDPNPRVAGEGFQRIRQAGIEVSFGVLEQQAEELNRGFCTRMRRGTPHIFSKIAMSLDGRTAMASGESRWISSDASRMDVQKLRAQSSAILTGVGTILSDNPRLTQRWQAGGRQPNRVILDTHLKTPLESALVNEPGDTWILCQEDINVDQKRRLESVGFRVQCLPSSSNGKLDLKKVCQWLGQQQYNNVMVEAGAVLNGAFLEQGLLDELIVYMAPHVMGDTARGMFHLPYLSEMSQRIPFTLQKVRQVGPDVRLEYRT